MRPQAFLPIWWYCFGILAFVFAFVDLPFSVIICFFGTSLLVSSWGFRTWLIPSRFTLFLTLSARIF
ncbi:hypothetical protein DFP73DRAFT_566573, partial [Morchella snyderi]